MKGITQTRLLVYMLLLGFLPLVFVVSYFLSAEGKQNSLSYALSQAIIDANNKNAREYVNKQVKQLFRDTDHFYIDKEIETISPLKGEIEALQKVLSRGFHTETDMMNKRVQFLKNGQNGISFVEGSVKSYPDFQETTESLAHGVEVDLADLKAILSRIEGVSLDGLPVPPQRPHLIVTDFKIDKKKGVSQEVYLLDLKVVKREYLK